MFMLVGHSGLDNTDATARATDPTIQLFMTSNVRKKRVNIVGQLVLCGMTAIVLVKNSDV
jgi:hypothetical protein